MIKFVILSFCLIGAITIVSTSELAPVDSENASISYDEDNSVVVQADNNNGPVANVVEKLPEISSNIPNNSELTADSESISELADNNEGPIMVENLSQQNSNNVGFTADNNNGPDSNILENLTEHNSHLLRVSALAPADNDDNNNNGPVSNLMENLSEHTSSVTNDLLSQLSAKMQRTAKTLAGNIEVVVSSALQQLSQPIEDFQIKINSSQCQPLVTFDELQQHIDSDLSKCTQNLSDILTAFQNDATDFEGLLEESISNIIALPKQCEGVESGNGFASHVSCYVEKIAEVNKQIASILNTASMTLVHTRQLAEQAVQEGRGCADNVVATTMEYLNKMLASCQLIGM